MVFRLFAAILAAARAYFAHGSFTLATVIDVAGIERLRPAVLALYAAAFAVDHLRE